tara:strand:- start:1089 stop:1529 length:441 start_codon:yes stop_codon:yes gene_type:complete
MSLSINVDGLVLPVSANLVALLIQIVNQRELTPSRLEAITAITFNFRDPTYSAEDGGYHPVEIRLGRQGDVFRLEYVTDFSFVGAAGWDAELAKEIDFDITWGKCEVRYCPPVNLADAASLYQTFESNFMSYHQMGVFDVSVATED